MITIERTFNVAKRPRRRNTPSKRPRANRVVSTPPVAPGRIPRISRLMALAIRFDRLLRDGVVRDQSALARLAHVSQPRMTQILNLLHLAPDIQEALLFLPAVTEGKDPITERDVRLLVAEVEWGLQRSYLKDLTTIAGGCCDCATGEDAVGEVSRVASQKTDPSD